MKLTRVGYWASETQREWPEVKDLVDADWDEAEKEKLATYLSHGILARAYLGKSTCRICESPNGSTELTDGTYVWPEGLSHYVLEHNVRIPAPFVEHALEVTESIENAEIDDSWWRGLT